MKKFTVTITPELGEQWAFVGLFAHSCDAILEGMTLLEDFGAMGRVEAKPC